VLPFAFFIFIFICFLALLENAKMLTAITSRDPSESLAPLSHGECLRLEPVFFAGSHKFPLAFHWDTPTWLWGKSLNNGAPISGGSKSK